MKSKKNKCEYLYINGMRVPMGNILVTYTPPAHISRITQSFRVVTQSKEESGETPYPQTVGELKKLLKHNKYSKMIAHIYDPETKCPVGKPFDFDPAKVYGGSGRKHAKGPYDDWKQFEDNEFVAGLLAKGVSYGKSKGLDQINAAQLRWLARTPAGTAALHSILQSVDPAMQDVRCTVAGVLAATGNTAMPVLFPSKIAEALTDLAPLADTLGFVAKTKDVTAGKSSGGLVNRREILLRGIHGGADTPVVRTDGEGRPLTSVAYPQRDGTITENNEANVRGLEDDIGLVQSEIESLEAAIADAETTGIWRGADFGVNFEKEEPFGDPVRAYLTRDSGGTRNPRNLSAEETKEKQAIPEAKSRLATAEKEKTRLARVAADKRTRKEQNVVDVEDIPAEEIEQLIAEAEDIKQAVKRRNEAKVKLRNDPRLADLDWDERESAIKVELDQMGMPDPLSPGEGQRAAIHVGADTLEGGVIDPGFTSGDESTRTGGGNTGSLNQNQIRYAKRYRDQTAARLKAAERILEELESGTATITPRDEAEASLLNGLTGSTRFSANQSMNLDTINSKFDVATMAEKISEKVRTDISRNRTVLAGQDARLKRVDESPKFGFVSAYPLSPEGTVTDGYFGRNSGKKVPADIGTFETQAEQTNRVRRTADGFVDVKDRPMLDRWKRTLRGTQWLIIGGDDTVVTGFGESPSDEMQVMGINKPVLGFSFGTESTGNFRGPLSDIGVALAARAVELRKSGIEVTQESVMQARRKVETSGIIMLARSGATIEEIQQKTGRSYQFVRELLELSGVTNRRVEG